MLSKKPSATDSPEYLFDPTLIEEIFPVEEDFDDFIDLKREEKPFVSFWSRLKLTIRCWARIARRNSPRHWASVSPAAARAVGVKAGELANFDRYLCAFRTVRWSRVM